MSDNKLLKKYYRIIAGYVPAIISIDNRRVYVKDPTASSIYLAEMEADSYIEDLSFNGSLQDDETEKILINRGLWTKKNQKELDDLQNQKEKIIREIYKHRLNAPVKKNWMLALETNKKRNIELITLKNALTVNTVEHIAEIYKYKYLLFLNTFDLSWNRVWSSFDDFLTLDDKVINRLLQDTYFNHDVKEEHIRKIARMEPWRTAWKSGDKNRLFDKPATEYTNLQSNLISWSMIYDSVYESSDCPDNDIINDDIYLDAWFIEQHEKRKNERKKNQDFTNNEKIKNSQEVGIIVSSPEEAATVYNMNDGDGLKVIKDRENALFKHGQLKEQELPDMKKRIQLAENRLKQEGIKKRGK